MNRTLNKRTAMNTILNSRTALNMVLSNRTAMTMNKGTSKKHAVDILSQDNCQ